MTELSVAIVLAVVLYLVDKNQKWKVFWRLTCGCAFLLIVAAGFLLLCDQLRANKASPRVDYDSLAKEYGGFETPRGGVLEPKPGCMPIFDPSGNLQDIPYAQVQAALARGGNIAVRMRAPDDSQGYVPANRVDDAKKAGGRVLSDFSKDEFPFTSTSKFDPNQPYQSEKR